MNSKTVHAPNRPTYTQSQIDALLEPINAALNPQPQTPVDLFADANNLTNGFYNNVTGVFEGGSLIWFTTDAVPATEGQVFEAFGRGFENNTLHSGGAIFFNADDEFIAGFPQGNEVTTVEHTAPAGSASVRFSLRNSGPEDGPPSVMIQGTAPAETEPEILTLDVDTVYGLEGEDLFVYGREITPIPDNLAWASELDLQAIGNTLRVRRDAGTHPLRLTTVKDGETVELASFNAVISEEPVNPPEVRHFIFLGDSLTEGTSNSGIEGAIPNAFSHKINGTGRDILPANSPAPFSLDNIQVIGTLGNEDIKHEGRGGWTARRYLTSSEAANAFYNPATGLFDIDFYLTENNFDTVSPSGDNLTFVIFLGWNDFAGLDIAESAARLGELIDRIKAGRSDTDFLVLGLNGTAELIARRITSGSRLLSKQQNFLGIREFGIAYKAECESRDNCYFLPIAPTFDPEIGYVEFGFATSNRSSDTVSLANDFNHASATGYAMIADTVAAWVINRYCQPGNGGGPMDLFDTVTDGFVTNTTGVFTANASWRATDFHPTTPGEVFTMTGRGFNQNGGAAFYDSSQTFISGSPQGNTAGTVDHTAPAGAAFVRFSSNVDGNPSVIV